MQNLSTEVKSGNIQQIVVAVTNDLATDQRVDRSCRALAEAGYGVLLVGRRLKESPGLTPRPYRVARMRLVFRRSAAFYAEYNLRLFLRLLFSRADAFYANDADTLLACCMAARLRNRKLFFDAHELFPDVPELVGKPRIQAVWRQVERRCLPYVDSAITVCQSLADEYGRRYGIKMAVVRNLPSLQANPTMQPQSSQPVILYQGAVNVGRGVRELIDVMNLLPGCRLIVAGNGDLLEQLKHYAAAKPWSNRIEFLGRIAPDDLRILTQKADVGTCLLEDLGLSYHYALPNRIGDMAQAGVPIVATGFPEIRRIVESYSIGTLVAACPSEKEGQAYETFLQELAAAINNTLLYWRQLSPDERRSRFSQARRDLCWENEKIAFLKAVEELSKSKNGSTGSTS